MNESENIICHCGYTKQKHEYFDGSAIECWEASDTNPIKCICKGYIPDNLLHIEKLAKERNLI